MLLTGADCRPSPGLPTHWPGEGGARPPTTRQPLPYWSFTHLSSKGLPTDGVLRATGVISVPPVQVQLGSTVSVGMEALDVHVRAQDQSHWGKEGQPSGPYPAPESSHICDPAQGPDRVGGCSKVQTRERQSAGQKLGLFPKNTPFPKATPAPSGFLLESDSGSTNARSIMGVSLYMNTWL